MQRGGGDTDKEGAQTWEFFNSVVGVEEREKHVGRKSLVTTSSTLIKSFSICLYRVIIWDKSLDITRFDYSPVVITDNNTVSISWILSDINGSVLHWRAIEWLQSERLRGKTKWHTHTHTHTQSVVWLVTGEEEQKYRNTSLLAVQVLCVFTQTVVTVATTG